MGTLLSLKCAPFSTCANPAFRTLCSSLAAITIQIPLDARSCPQCPPYGIPTGSLNIRQNGASRFVDVNPLADQVHILTSCDPFMTTVNYAAHDPRGLPCPSLVAHADGSLVSVKNPAKTGEEVVAY